MDKYFTILKWVLIAGLCTGALAIAAFVYYIENSIDKVISKERQDELISVIDSTPKLPDSFHNTIQANFPNHYSSGVWHSVFYQLTSQTGAPSCCRAIYLHPGFVDRTPRLWQLILAAWMEDNFSQKRCYEFDLSVKKYGYGVTGLAQASENYYDKPIGQLTEQEIIKLVQTGTYPFRYDPTGKQKN